MADTSEVCVFNERADTFLLGVRASSSGEECSGILLVKTLRPFRLPTVLCNERVSPGAVDLEPGLRTAMNP